MQASGVNSRSESRRLQFLHEVVNAVAWCSRRKEILHRHLQHFSQVKQRLVVNVRKARFDFRDSATADVESRELQFSREIGLRPAETVSATAHLRADVVFVAHVDVDLALFGLGLGSFKTHARRALNLAKLDELRGAAPRQRIRSFVAEVRDRFQVMARLEKIVERFTSERENLVECFVFGRDMREKRGRRKINARDAAIGSARGPAGAAAIRDNEVFFVAFSFPNEFAFEGFETLPVGCECSVQRYRFVYQFL